MKKPGDSYPLSRRDFFAKGSSLGLLPFLPFSSGAISFASNPKKQKLIPRLKEDWWLIGPPPDVQEEGIPEKKTSEIEVIECVIIIFSRI